MKPIFVILTAAVVSLCTGIFAGRQSAAARVAPTLERQSTGGGESIQTKSQASQKVFTAPVESHDLAALLRWSSQTKGTGLDYTTEIERMKTSDIRELLAGLSGEDQHSTYPIFEAGAKELFRREGEKSLAWASGLDPAMGRRMILSRLVAAAVGESPALAKPWIDRYRLEYDKNEDRNFARAAADGAAARSTGELVELRNIMGEGLFAIPEGPFPAGFDYALFLKNFRAGEPETREAAQRWALQDRDAAWATAKEIAASNGVNGVQLLGAIHKAVILEEGEEKAARWAVARLDEIPEDARDWALRSLLSESRDPALTLSSLLTELPREFDRLVLVTNAISPYNHPAEGIAALRALGSEAQQVQALLKSTESFSWSAGEPGNEAETKKQLQYFTKVMDGLQISADSREKITAQFRPR